MKEGLIILLSLFIANSIFGQIVRMSGTSELEIANAEKRKSLSIIKSTEKRFNDSLSYIANVNYKIQSIKEYNNHGDLIKTHKSKKDGSVYLSAACEYDDHHNRLLVQQYDENGQESGVYQAVMMDSVIIGERRYPGVMSVDSSYFAFDHDGLRRYDVTYKNGQLKDSTVYSNKNGNRVLAESYLKGKLEYVITYEYLTNEDYIERIFERDSTLRLKRYWKYTEDKKIIERVEFNGNDQITTWYSYSYDCEGNEISSAVYKSKDKKLSFRTEKEYENNNLRFVRHYDEKNELTSISEYYYDKNDMVVLWISRNYRSGQPEVSFISKTEYEFGE